MDEPTNKILNITVTISDEESHRLIEGEEFSWVFHTEEEPNTIIRCRITNEKGGEYGYEG